MSDTELKPPSWLGPARIAVGLVQGLLLFWLHRAEMDGYWPSGAPTVFGALAIASAYAPLIVIGGLGAVRPRTLALWATGVTLLLAWIGWHGGESGAVRTYTAWPQPHTFFAGAAITFIGHHLVAAGDEARRWIAPYDRYFDLGWRHAAQLALSCAFTGGLWILLFLGSSLFEVIKITALRELIQKDWFYYPVTTVAFAAAIHLTDLRSSLVRGFRALSLMLLSWLMPMFTLLSAAFLLALPFTGLGPLWETRAAGAILLSAAANLIILINAAYQDGGDETSKSGVLRWSARLAGVLLAPLVIIAGIALWLRLDQHGLSPERVLAAACVFVGAVYAGFYAVASFSKPWMKLIERANICSAFIALAVLIALFTPIADPSRLSVDQQIARLHGGAVSVADFDYAFLWFDSGAYGKRAMAQLRADRSTPQAREIAGRADEVASYTNEWEARRALGQNRYHTEDPVQRRDLGNPTIELIPGSPPLPESFAQLARESYIGGMGACRRGTAQCEAFVLNADAEPGLEVLVRAGEDVSLYDERNGEWIFAARADVCGGSDRNAVRTGDIETAAPLYNDLLIGGTRLQLQPDIETCQRTDFQGP